MGGEVDAISSPGKASIRKTKTRNPGEEFRVNFERTCRSERNGGNYHAPTK